MKGRLRHLACTLAAPALLLAGLDPPPAASDTIPYTTALVSTFNPAESTTPKLTHSAPASAASVSYRKSGDWGSVSAFASADLSTGQLKVQAADSPTAGHSPYIQSNAWFGDGFRTSDSGGSPFSWTPDSGAQFHLDLTGSAVTSTGTLGSGGLTNVGAFILLTIYDAGTLTPDSKLVGGDNNVQYFLYLLGNPNQNLTYTDPEGGHHSIIPTAYYGNLSQDTHITQNFQPGGDFDWTILVGIAGQVSGPNAFDIDLSHTLTVGYSGPLGTRTESVSGLFNNFAPYSVPEPGGMALLLIGAAGVLTGRRLAGRR